VARLDSWDVTAYAPTWFDIDIDQAGWWDRDLVPNPVVPPPPPPPSPPRIRLQPAPQSFSSSGGISGGGAILDFWDIDDEFKKPWPGPEITTFGETVAGSETIGALEEPLTRPGALVPATASDNDRRTALGRLLSDLLTGVMSMADKLSGTAERIESELAHTKARLSALEARIAGSAVDGSRLPLLPQHAASKLLAGGSPIALARLLSDLVAGVLSAEETMVGAATSMDESDREHARVKERLQDLEDTFEGPPPIEQSPAYAPAAKPTPPKTRSAVAQLLIGASILAALAVTAWFIRTQRQVPQLPAPKAQKRRKPRKRRRPVR
jgi:hypothetical protein